MDASFKYQSILKVYVLYNNNFVSFESLHETTSNNYY